MSFRVKCPVCRIGWRLQRNAKTCSHHCAKEWKDWTPEQRRKAELISQEDIAEVINRLKTTGNDSGEDSLADKYSEPLAEEAEGDEAATHILKILGDK